VAANQPAVRQPPFPVAAGPAGQTTSAAGGDSYKWIAAPVVLVGAVMVILDQTVVNVALPTLQKDFDVSLTQIQWVVTAYSLALAAVIPMSGWLSDRYGAKRIFFTTQLLFTCSSALCGLAWSHGSLIGFRVLQGLAGGLIMRVGMAILMSISRPDERGRLMSVMGVPMLIAPVLGPTLGGWFVQAVSWRLIFYINVPIGIAGCLLTALLLRRTPAQAEAGRLDALGLLLVTPAVGGMVYGLSQPSTYGWDSVQTLLPLFAGLLLLIVFCLYELRQDRPLIDIRVFRDAAFSAAMGLGFLVGFALFAAMVLMPLFLQQVQGYGPYDAGLILAAQGLGAAIVMPLSGRLTDRFGASRVVPIGLTIVAAGTVWMTTLAASTPAWQVALMVGLRGVGMGCTMMPAMSSAYVTLQPRQIARATSVSNVVQRVAAALGVAVMATILSNRITANLPALPRGVTPASGAGIGGAHIPGALKSYLLAQAAKGYDDTFWVTTGLVLLGFPMALLLRKAMRPDEVRAYAINQLGQGLILGAAAQRLRDGRLNGLTGKIDRLSAFRLLATSATRRLETAGTLIRAGTAASGLVPRNGLSRPYRALVGIVFLAALVGMVVAFVHGFQAPVVPTPPGLAAH
jgi:EmrB/QacA subfamily drug resistance transporter